MLKANTRLATCFHKAVTARPLSFPRYIHRNDGPRKEYFVLVWDHPQANRANLSLSEFTFPQFTFAGECLSPAGTDEGQAVRGNAFACLARNEDEVQEIMKESLYYKKGVWDISTAQISPLMTVHSRDYQGSE